MYNLIFIFLKCTKLSLSSLSERQDFNRYHPCFIVVVEPMDDNVILEHFDRLENHLDVLRVPDIPRAEEVHREAANEPVFVEEVQGPLHHELVVVEHLPEGRHQLDLEEEDGVLVHLSGNNM